MRKSSNPNELWLFVSPHLDDAVLSAGGRIADLGLSGQRVVVLTVFAGVPKVRQVTRVARKFHKLWGLGNNAIAVRRDEDLEAAGVVGAEPLHLSHLDDIYRSSDSVAEISDSIASEIRRLGPTAVATCRGTGLHPDHLRTLEATVAAARRCKVPQLELWEDLPYALWSQETPDLPGSLQHVEHSISTQAVSLKHRAILSYRSQLSTLETEGQPVSDGLMTYCSAAGQNYTERFWNLSSESAA